MQNQERQFGENKEKTGQEYPEYSGGTYAKQNRPLDGMQGQASEEKSADVSKEGFILERDKPQPERQTYQEQAPPPIDKSQETKINQGPTMPQNPETTVPPPAPKAGFPSWLKIIILIILVLVVVSGAYLLFFYKSTFEISVSQPDSKVTLDNKIISTGVNKIRPGSYSLKIEKDGFVPYNQKIEINYFKKTSITVVLKEIPIIISIYNGEANYLAYNKEYDIYLFYVAKESAFFRVSANKVEEEKGVPLLTTPHYVKNVIDIIWNPDRMTAILKIKNENETLAGTPFYKPEVAQGEVMTFLYDFGRYDLLHQEAHFWGTGFGDIKFTPKGDQVAYFYEPGTGEKSLVIANKDNSAMNRITDLRNFERPMISWSPDLKKIVLVNRSTNYETNKIYVFDLIDKSLDAVTDFGRNIEAVFDSKGEKIVYSTYSSDPDFTNFSLLSVMDKDGQNKKELKIRSYVPQTSFNSSGELLALAENEKDNYLVVSINLSSLKKIEYAFSGKIISPVSLEYIEAKNSIIFIDQNKPNLLFLTTKEYE